jgi:hypothetical protein
MKNAVTILLVVCTFYACGGEEKRTDTLAAPQKPIASIDTKKFEAVQRAGQGLRSAVGLGVQVARYRELLQTFDQEVAIARDNATNDSERKVAEAYGEALSIYRDALTLWSVKFNAFNVAVRDLGARLGAPYNGMEKLPDQKDPELVAVLARYNIKADKDGDVAVDRYVKLIWQKASESLDAANKALHAG